MLQTIKDTQCNDGIKDMKKWSSIMLDQRNIGELET